MELTGGECWKLLASVPFGRVVFSQHAMPAVQIVSHLVDEGTIVARSPRGDVIPAHPELAGTIALRARDAVIRGSFCRSDPAAELRGLTNSRSPASA